jgi:hypothetical protein
MDFAVALMLLTAVVVRVPWFPVVPLVFQPSVRNRPPGDAC